MHYLLSFVLLFVIGSCSKEAPAENEELAAIDFRSRIDQVDERPQEVFKLDLHQYFVLAQLAELERQKRALEEEIEGGNRKKIPILESVMGQISSYDSTLASILDRSCSFLKFREQQLKMEIILGNKDAREALEEVQRKLRGCGLSLPGYKREALETLILAVRVGGKVGGNCEPGIEFDRCIPKMDSGMLLVNSIDAQDGTEVTFKTTDGRVISGGKLTGEHAELEGVWQTAIELEPITNGLLEFKGRTDSFSQTIKVE